MLKRSAEIFILGIIYIIAWPVIGVLWLIIQPVLLLMWLRVLFIVRSPRVWFQVIKAYRRLSRQVGYRQATNYFWVIPRIINEQNITDYSDVLKVLQVAVDLTIKRPDYTPQQIERQMENWAKMQKHLRPGADC